MRQLVARYSVAPYNVKYWEMGNEIDAPYALPPSYAFGCWGEPSDPYYGGGQYGEMLKAIYPQMKASDPQAQVLVGGLLLDCDPRQPGACSTPDSAIPPRFLEGILRNPGASSAFDGVAFHAYDYYAGALGVYSNRNWASAWNTTGPASLAKISFVKGVLAQYGASGKYLVNTESAILCNSQVTNLCNDDFQTTKAYYVAQSYAVAIAERLRISVWYSPLGGRGESLLAPDLSPLPAYTAYRFARSELRDATFSQNLPAQVQSTAAGYVLNRGDRLIWVLWSRDGVNHTITLPGVPIAIFDALGQSQSPSQSVVASIKPLYIEWNP
jgi:hypothetical protein